MSNYYDMTKVMNRLNEIFKPFISTIETIDINGIKSFSEKMAKLSEISASLKDTPLNDSIIKSATNIRSLMKAVNFEEINFSLSESSQKLLESIRPISDMINKDLVFFKNDYSEMLRNFNDSGYDVPSIAEQIYEENEKDTSDDFKSNKEIVEIFKEQEKNPIGFQEKVADWSESKKKKFYIIYCIIYWIFTIYIVPYLQDNGKPVMASIDAKVRELPKVASSIIDELKEYKEAFIVEDVPYYYKVIYTDENGKQKAGYVAKKNLVFVKELDEQQTTDNIEK